MADWSNLFERTVASRLGDWSHCELRGLAEYLRGRWVLTALRVRLTSNEVNLRTDLPRTERVRAFHSCHPATCVQKVVADLKAGHLEVGDERYEFMWNEPNPPRVYVPSGTVEDQNGYPSFIFRAQEFLGNIVDRDYDPITDGELQTLSRPWDGRQEIRRDFIGVPDDVAHHETGYLLIEAPQELRLSASLVEGSWRLTVSHKETHDPNQIKVAAFAAALGQRFDRRLVALTSGDGNTLISMVRFDHEPSAVTFVLTYRGIEVQRLDFVTPRIAAEKPRFVLAKVALGASEDLAEWKIEGRQGRPLEALVATVFFVAGFSSPRPLRTDATDVVAVASGTDSETIVIECTGPSDQIEAKISKLRSRANVIETETGRRVLPVLLTSVIRNVLPVGVTNAGEREKVAILTRDEWPSLLQRMIQPESEERVTRFLHDLVPKVDRLKVAESLVRFQSGI